MNRRNFLMALGLMTISGKLLSDVCVEEYKKNLIKKIYYEVPNYIYVIESYGKGKLEDGDTEIENKMEGYGIVYKNHFLTVAHVANVGVKYVKTLFGIRELDLELSEEKHSVRGKELEEVVLDRENDVAVYKVSKELDLKRFPCKPSTSFRLGDEVYLVGNPDMRGFNIRQGRISDLDKFDDGSRMAEYTQNCFGMDVTPNEGDSGCPVVNSKYELLGLCVVGVGRGDMVYIKRIGEFLKHLEVKK